MTAPVPSSRGVRRSRGDGVLGGVCAGVARSAGLDPLLLRIAVVAVTLLTAEGTVSRKRTSVSSTRASQCSRMGGLAGPRRTVSSPTSRVRAL